MKILIWGTGNTTIDAMLYLREDIEVVAFVDSYAKNEDELFLGKPVITIEKADKYDWEMLVICSIHKEAILDKIQQKGIPLTNVLCFDKNMLCKVARYKQDLFHKCIKRLEDNVDEVEMLITGISYHGEGIVDNLFAKTTVNFAMRSQDLFFDYYILNYVFSNYRLDQLKYVMIGLCYYSFDHDFSKTHNAWEMIRYYPEIQKGHNLIEDCVFEEWCVQEMNEIMASDKLTSVFSWKMRFRFSDAEGQKEAAIYFKENRPITVLENKLLLKKYLELLEKKNIKPIIVIMPVTGYYSKFVPEVAKERFYTNLYEVLGKKEVQILDYFDRCFYPDEYFYNVSHLNKKGAEVFTKRLEQDIVWRL